MNRPILVYLRTRGHDFTLPFVKYNFNERILLSEPCTIIFILLPIVIFWVVYCCLHSFACVLVRLIVWFIISAKWTKWMAEIMRSFDVCLFVGVCVCLCVRSGRSWELNANSYGLQIWHTCSHAQYGRDPQKFSQKGALPRSRDPLNFWALNANSSKMVKATEFKFDTRFPRDNPDKIAKNFAKRGRSHGHVTPKIFGR